MAEWLASANFQQELKRHQDKATVRRTHGHQRVPIQLWTFDFKKYQLKEEQASALLCERLLQDHPAAQCHYNSRYGTTDMIFSADVEIPVQKELTRPDAGR